MQSTCQLDEDDNIELFMSCRNINIQGKCTVQIYIYINNNNKWSKLVETEQIQDEQNPNFKQTLKLHYVFECKQELKFELWNTSQNELIGEVQTTLGYIIGQQIQTAILDINSNNNNSKLIIRGEYISNNRDILIMKWQGINLHYIKGWLSNIILIGKWIQYKLNPYLIFYRQRTDKSWLKIHQTEYVLKTQYPSWKTIQVKASHFCQGNYDMQIKVELVHYIKGNTDKYIGEFYFSIYQIQHSKNREFNILYQGKCVGSVCLVEFDIQYKPQFIDYIRGGTQIQLILAIDFTSSNGQPNTPNSLHTTTNTTDNMNQYQQAIQAVCNILLNYNQDKLVPLYGFGAKLKYPNLFYNNTTSHCFPLTGNPDSPEVYGLDGIMSTYLNTLQYIELSGPTYLNPLLLETFKLTTAIKHQTLNIYTILLILTDGTIHDFTDTLNTLYQASYLPLSILIIGIGNDDFTNLHTLNNYTQHFKGYSAQRQLVSFIPYGLYSNNPSELASIILKNIPEQLVQYHTLNSILPSHYNQYINQSYSTPHIYTHSPLNQSFIYQS